MFSKQTYIERRSKLKKKFNSGIALFLGNEESSMNFADNTYHFRQDSSFLYLFGLDYPSLAAVIDFDEGKDYIFGDDLSIDYIIWTGVLPTIKENAAKAGIENTAPISKLEQVLSDAKQKGRKIHFLPPYRPENKLKLLKWLNVNPEKTQALASVELIKAVVEQRNIKSEEEIAEIEKAVNITADMHIAAMRMVRPGLSEAQVAAEVNRIALEFGGNLSFPIIATINGQTLHNHFHGNTLESGKLFLLDAGAETAMHYAGDMTSTFPVDKKFTNIQKDIFNVCLAAKNEAATMIKPGIKNKEVHLAACKVIAEGMKEMGFMKGNIDDAIVNGAHAMFMPHGLGHMMGLDVHDMEDLGEVYVGYSSEAKSTQFGLKSLRLGRTLEPGFVLTIEPGIYFIPELINLWKKENKHTEFLNYDKIEQFKNFGGIRSESDYTITKSGSRLLGKPIPQTVEEIEKEREKAF